MTGLKEERGLNEGTIKKFNLGLNVSDQYQVYSAWGIPPEKNENGHDKGVFLPKGITIPCFEEDMIHYVNIRRPEGDPKYLKIKGSHNALLGTDFITGKENLILPEGEFDAMLLYQIAGDIVDVATLGSATGCLDIGRWFDYLILPKAVLIAYDNDEAGRKAAKELERYAPKIHAVKVPVLNPGDNDITDYWRSGGDIRAWILHIAGLSHNDIQPASTLDEINPDMREFMLHELRNHTTEQLQRIVDQEHPAGAYWKVAAVFLGEKDG